MKIRRKTTEFQSLMLRKYLPGCLRSATGKDFTVRRISNAAVKVLLHPIYLNSNLTPGSSVVGMIPRLPMKCISTSLRNGIIGGKDIIPSHAKPRLVTSTKDKTRNDSSHVLSCVCRPNAGVDKRILIVREI